MMGVELIDSGIAKGKTYSDLKADLEKTQLDKQISPDANCFEECNFYKQCLSSQGSKYIIPQYDLRDVLM